MKDDSYSKESKDVVKLSDKILDQRRRRYDATSGSKMFLALKATGLIVIVIFMGGSSSWSNNRQIAVIGLVVYLGAHLLECRNALKNPVACPKCLSDLPNPALKKVLITNIPKEEPFQYCPYCGASFAELVSESK